jgi:hypothetical protein
MLQLPMNKLPKAHNNDLFELMLQLPMKKLPKAHNNNLFELIAATTHEQTA